MYRGKTLLLATLAGLLCLGMVPVSKAGVEMHLYPYRVSTYPGGQVYFNLIVINDDTVSHNFRLEPELLCWTGDTLRYRERYFSLGPGESLCQGFIRRVPLQAPLGEYILMMRLYDDDTGQWIALEHSHIYVERQR